MKNMKNRTVPFGFEKTGFTFVELLMVIMVLGILGAIIYPKISGLGEKSRVGEAVGILNTIRQGEKAYFLDKGAYLDILTTATDAATNAEWAKLGIDNPNSTGKYFTYAVDGDNTPNPPTFTATATRNSTNAGPGDDGATVTINQDGTYDGTHLFKPT